MSAACKYSAAESPIELHCAVIEASATQPAKPMVRLELSNLPGKAGWPDSARVFDKYYRSPQAQRQSGTGLGLYLVRNLVQALGGHIAYQPDATVVRFVLTLPLRAPRLRPNLAWPIAARYHRRDYAFSSPAHSGH